MNILTKYAIPTPGIPGGLEMVMRVKQAFSRGFRNRLIQHGLSQREFADKFSHFVKRTVDEATVSHWASGKRVPRDETFDEICRFFSAEPYELLGGTVREEKVSQPPVTSLPDGRVIIDLPRLAEASGFKLVPKDS